jgi:N-acetylmuramoyl-L-alanine amidase
MKRLLFIILLIFISTPFFAHAQTPIKILLVPGHDDESWGAQYGNLKEADMNLKLALSIYDLLKKDPRFQVYITRTWQGYTPEFANYFESEEDKIIKFRDDAKRARASIVEKGEFVQGENVPHNPASQHASIFLYGINQWASSHDIDLVLHIHFNDYPRASSLTAGKYKGFAIYVPEEQMVNSTESTSLGTKIYNELGKKYAVSDYPPESAGIVPDQNLIALGANGTLVPLVKSILVEYGYIYRFGNSALRHRAYTNFANLTATGIKNYFFPK